MWVEVNSTSFDSQSLLLNSTAVFKSAIPPTPWFAAPETACLLTNDENSLILWSIPSILTFVFGLVSMWLPLWCLLCWLLVWLSTWLPHRPPQMLACCFCCQSTLHLNKIQATVWVTRTKKILKMMKMIWHLFRDFYNEEKKYQKKFKNWNCTIFKVQSQLW